MNHVYPSLNFNTDQLLTHVGQLVFNSENLLTLRAAVTTAKGPKLGARGPESPLQP